MKTPKRRSICPPVLLALLLSACAGQPTPPPAAMPANRAHRNAENDVGKALGEAARPAPASTVNVPPAVSAALLPGTGDASAGAQSAAHRFNLSVHNLDAHSFFVGLAQGTPYNMVVEPGVSGQISLTLKNVTVPEVMQMVRSAYGYDYSRQGLNYIVRPATVQTRIFHVNYLDIQRDGQSKTLVTSGESTQNPYGQSAQMGNLANPYGGANNGGNGNGQLSTRESISSEVVTKQKSDFWKDLKASLQAIVGDKDGRRIIVDPDTGVVVVRALPAELREVGQYLDAVQNNAHREVLIEAKFIEVTLNHNFQTGINWTALGRPSRGNSILLGQTGGQGLFSNGTSDLAGQSLNVGPGQSITSLASSAFGGTFAAALNLNDFNAFLELLDTQGTVHVLSSPRIATVNNQKAIIKVGSDEFFVTGLSSSTLGGLANNSTNQNIVLTPFFSGIALDVTPQISSDGYVTLQIHPSISKVTDQTKQITFQGQQSSIPLAFSQIREADSVVRAKSGQIVAIGGLMKTEENNQNANLPYLSDIPLLGELFKQKKRSSTKTELVILLKPIIIKNDQTWSQIGRQHLQQYKDMGDPGP